MMDGTSKRAWPGFGRRDLLRGAVALPFAPALGGRAAAPGADEDDRRPWG